MVVNALRHRTIGLILLLYRHLLGEEIYQLALWRDELAFNI